MLGTERRHLSRLALLFGVALVIAACDSGQSSSSSSSSGGGGSWEARFERGEPSAVKELGEKGSQAVPIVIALLGNNSVQVVGMAALASKKMGPAGDETVGALFAALKRFPDQAFVVQAIKFRKDAAIPEVVKALRGGDVKMQEQATKLLNGGLAARGEPAVDALIVILEGNAPDKTKIEVMGALASIGIPADDRARPVFLRIQAEGGALAMYAKRNIRRLDSAHAWKKAREATAAEKAAKGE